MDCTSVLWVGVAVAAIAVGYGIAELRFRNAQQGPTEGEDDTDVWEVVQSLQRSQKMLQGRLNALAPPRTGTGKPDEPEPAPQAGQVPVSPRAQVLAVYKAQRGIR